MAETLDLDRFLEQLAAEGHKDSSGVFTLDPLQAQQKLRRYQFQHPYAFVGAFMAAASLAGATSVVLEVEPHRLGINWSSPHLGPEQLQRLLAHLLAERASPSIRELALGINSALALKPTRLTLSSGKFRQHFTPQRHWQTEEEESLAGLHLELVYAPRERLKRRLNKELPEIQLLKRSCLFAAPFVEVNQRRLLPQSPAGRCLVGALLEGGSPATMARLRASLPAAPIQLTYPGEGPHCGAFALYLDQPESVGLVVDGLVFAVPGLELPGAWGVLLAPQLKRDLSAFELVKDASYDESTAVVGAIFGSMLDYFCDRWQDMEWEARLESAIVVTHNAIQKVIHEDVFGAHELFAKVMRLYEDASVKLDMAYFEAAYALWLLNLREGLTSDDYHAREFFRTFAEKVEATYQLELTMVAIGVTRGTFRVDAAANSSVCEEFLAMVTGMDRLILGETHPHTHFHESRACRPRNLKALLSTVPSRRRR